MPISPKVPYLKEKNYYWRKGEAIFMKFLTLVDN